MAAVNAKFGWSMIFNLKLYNLQLIDRVSLLPNDRTKSFGS